MKRAERWTILLTICLIMLFVTGLFYDTERDPNEDEEEDEKTIEESLSEYSWKDFWITIYSVIATVPVPLISKILLKRVPLNPGDGLEVFQKQMKKMKIKRMIAYVLLAGTCAWCTWSVIMFSLAFGYNTTQIWLVTVSVSAIFKFLIKDTAVAVGVVLLIMYLPVLCKKCKKSKDDPT